LANSDFALRRISKIVRESGNVVEALRPLVVHEDNHQLIIFKPPGWLSQSDSTGDLSVNEIFAAYLKQKYHKPGNVFCAAVHRLDRVASGLLVLARTSKAAARISETMRAGKFAKRYHVLTTNPLPEGDNRRSIVLTGDMKKMGRMARRTDTPDADSWYALNARPIGPNHYEVEIDTGKFHQIRALFAAHGSPILGDVKYGAKPLNREHDRIALIATNLKFEHPTLKKPQVFYVEANSLKNMRSYFI